MLVKTIVMKSIFIPFPFCFPPYFFIGLLGKILSFKLIVLLVNRKNNQCLCVYWFIDSRNI